MDCCIPAPTNPSREISARASSDAPPAKRPGAHNEEMVCLGGEFLMGTRSKERNRRDGEDPVRRITISPFAIAPATVTNRQFAEFAEATRHVTDAERFGWSFVFREFVSPEIASTVDQAAARAAWWWKVEGAWWREPEGAGSSIDDRMEHPVVHVSWRDASAYASWRGGRLPTEAEWEFAARGGLEQALFPWGDELRPDGKHMCNIWQGNFPNVNTMEDGYAGTAPARSFPPNDYGLYNVSGNVWEWCLDWFSRRHHVAGPRVDPAGPSSGHSKVAKGGSYLCHKSYCNRYRPAARTASTTDSSTGHMGFRLAMDAPPPNQGPPAQEDTPTIPAASRSL